MLIYMIMLMRKEHKRHDRRFGKLVVDEAQRLSCQASEAVECIDRHLKSLNNLNDISHLFLFNSYMFKILGLDRILQRNV